jgi:DNA-binding transcriptional MerR regulator
MGTMLNIGDFARMTFLSVKALRHYHEVGLLAPAEVDPESGYRRYALAQVPKAQVIRRLRELGMPIDDVRSVVEAPNCSASLPPQRCSPQPVSHSPRLCLCLRSSRSFRRRSASRRGRRDESAARDSGAWGALVLALTELDPTDLAGQRLRKIVDEFNLTRVRVR